MRPKKSLPKDSERLTEIGNYILVKSSLNKLAYYSIYEYFEAADGPRYWPRGAGSYDLDSVIQELERITGRKMKTIE